MSYSVAPRGYEMYYDWDKPIRDAHFQNMLAYDKSMSRAKLNGELSYDGYVKSLPAHYKINKELEGGKLKSQGTKNDLKLKTRCSNFYDVNGGNSGYEDNQVYSKNKNLNRLSRYNPITEKKIPTYDYEDNTQKAYNYWWSTIKTGQGMMDTTQDPNNNWKCKKYMKY